MAREQDHFQACPEADAVKQRLAWTIRMVKHYQALEQDVKKQYGLERTRVVSMKDALKARAKAVQP